MTADKPSLFRFDVKARLVVVFWLAWLASLVVLICFCPQYLPEADVILSADFESGMHKGDTGVSVSYSSERVAPETGTGDAGGSCMRLTATDGKASFLKWILANPRQYSFLEFRGKMRTEKIIAGKYPWNTARSLVYFTDNTGKGRWDYPHTAATVEGTSPWKEFVKVFPVPDFAVTANVVVQNSSRSGTLWCDNISLRSVQLNKKYFLYKNIIIVFGVILGIISIWSFGLLKNRGLIPLVVVGCIVAGVMCSGNYLEMVAGIFNLEVGVLKKLGHLSLFCILGFAVTSWYGATRKNFRLSFRHLVFIFMLMISFAALTEFLQFTTLDRSPGGIDLLIDTIGTITGMIVALWVRPVRGAAKMD